MTSIRVRVFTYNTVDITPVIIRIYNLADKGNKYKNIEFVTNNTYTHAIIISTSMPKIYQLPKENVLGLAYEPDRIIKMNRNKKFLKYVSERVGKYFYGEGLKHKTPRLGRIFSVHYSYMTHVNIKIMKDNDKKEFNKKYPISLIASFKTMLPGHKYRHKLIKELFKTEIDIHVYGRRLDVKKDSRIKGDFHNSEPYEDYQFTIVIENSQSELYISEKYINPLAYKCIPIYFGASKIDSVFGSNCCHKLTGDLEKDVEIISKIYRNPEKYIISLDNAKKEIYEGKACLPEFLNEYWGK